MRSWIHYVPIVTTFFATFFAVVMFRRWRERRGTHVLWWAIGMVSYAAGTLTESLTTLIGWQEPVFRAWYITGALLGGMPLAQGSAYLHLSSRAATRWAVAVCTVVVIASALVILSPIDVTAIEPHRLSGRVLELSWVRLFSPFVNTYALLFLVGGAIASAVKFRRDPALGHRFLGNVGIAVGGLLPGIGGAFTRAGHVEVLYVTELVGLLLIYVGYRLNVREATPTGRTARMIQVPQPT
ncbi:MAG TPA: hypothetical protein VJR92_06960 [Gemmatimonadaceae bacterium]|nr:hypothetical protein [Gemmatimonadaceae bacterium]